VIREEKTDESVYRFGYQGRFAEKDEETGKNYFELRSYDPVIGRWQSIDPYQQFPSPYIGMGNNPVVAVDPRGGTCFDSQGRPIACPDDMKEYSEPGNNLHFLDEIEITPSFWDYVSDFFDFGSYGVRFWGSGDFGTNEMGQRDPSGKKIIDVDVGDLDILNSHREFNRPGGSRYDPNQRKNVNPPPGKQAFDGSNQVSKTADEIYSKVEDMNNQPHQLTKTEQYNQTMDSLRSSGSKSFGVVIYHHNRSKRDSSVLIITGPDGKSHWKYLK
jgi:RHS repeat-associated protein